MLQHVRTVVNLASLDTKKGEPTFGDARQFETLPKATAGLGWVLDGRIEGRQLGEAR
jgi:hypothetical protein